MKNIEEFKKRLDWNDLVVGDSFWLDGIEFEVINNTRIGIK